MHASYVRMFVGPANFGVSPLPLSKKMRNIELYQLPIAVQREAPEGAASALEAPE